MSTSGKKYQYSSPSMVTRHIQYNINLRYIDVVGAEKKKEVAGRGYIEFKTAAAALAASFSILLGISTPTGIAPKAVFVTKTSAAGGTLASRGYANMVYSIVRSDYYSQVESLVHNFLHQQARRAV